MDETNYMLPTRNPHHFQGHMQTESEEMKKKTFHANRKKESLSKYNYIRQNRLLYKDCDKRQRKLLYNKVIHPTRGYFLICTPNGSTEI